MKSFNCVLAILMVITVSCADFIDLYPESYPSDKTFLTSQTEMEMALTSCYEVLYSQIGAASTMPINTVFESISDNGYQRNAGALQAIGQGAFDSKNAVLEKTWKAMYQGIGRCNYLLQNMARGEANVSPDIYQRIRAEAIFLRSFYYMFLTELFGDVPYVDKVISLSESQLPKTSKSEIIDKLITDINDSYTALYDIKETSGHATQGAALALKARIALYNERWDDVIDACSKVMQMGYTLDPDFANPYTYQGQKSNEIIFSIQYVRSQKDHQLYGVYGSRTAGINSSQIPSYQLADSYECIDGLSIDKSPLYDPKRPWENRDPRLSMTIALPGSVFLGFQYETHGDSLECWDYNTTPARRVANQDAISPYASYSGICWRKYCNIEDRPTPWNCEINSIIFRYAEILLMYAEAKVEKGDVDDSVLQAINMVRNGRDNVKMPSITTMDIVELRYAIRRERRYEFAGEGLRFFDIRRWRLAEVVMNQPVMGRMKRSYPDVPPRIDENATPFYDNIPIASQGESSDFKMRVVDNRKFDKDKDYTWPIPYIEQLTNPNL